MFSGENVQDDWSGSPEQESVTNIGAVRDEALMGVIVAAMVPDWPGVSVTLAGATEMEKSGVATVAAAATGLISDMEAAWSASPR